MDYKKYPKELVIGFVGEQDARTPGIDISELLAELPGATPTLLFRRPREDAAYPCAAALNAGTGILTWTVSSGDVRFPGAGYAQVLLTKTVSGAEKRLMGPVIPVTVMKSVSDDFGEAPDAYGTWLTEAAETLADVEDALSDAQAAVTSANAAVTSANTAVTNANAAVTSADTAIAGANAAAQSLEGMTVEASYAAAAGATVSKVSGHYHIAFDLPRGEKGDKGDTGNQGPAGQIETAAATAALPASGWSGSGPYTLTVTDILNVTGDKNVVVSPAPAYRAQWAACGVACTGQGLQTLTFTAESLPASDLAANLLIF